MGFFKNVGTLFDRLINPEEYADIGTAGERFTYRELADWFKKRQIIRNVYLKKKNGELTEIDLLAVSQKCILVVESKNYSGWIFGDEKDSNWTQTLGRDRKHSFFNPIIQNQVHIKALAHNLPDFPALPLLSLIVFSDRCTLKSVSCAAENTYVIYRRDLPFIMKKTVHTMPKVISEEERDGIIDLLSATSRPDEAVKNEHLQQVLSKAERCPKCQGELVERTAKHTGGTFLGCKNFPKCRYTEDC